METDRVRQRVEAARDAVRRVREEISKAVVGHREAVEGVLVCLVCGGHALLEGVPGLGKTTLIRSLGQTLALKATRIQFTPDLMPADIIGTNVLIQDEEEHRVVRFQPGPVFTNILLADEINRATPKTQSALLEAMQERTVTVAGKTYTLQSPFIVLATQNPIEMEGTYPLPEAQLDRFFFKLQLDYPDAAEIARIVDLTTGSAEARLVPVMDDAGVEELRLLVREVPLAASVRDYAVRLALATRPTSPLAPERVRRYVRYGASPRGPQSMVLAAKARALFDGRLAVDFEDVRAVARPALRHRILLGFEGEAEGVSTESLIDEVLAAVPAEGRGNP
jgi:MoxR-like ATPase